MSKPRILIASVIFLVIAGFFLLLSFEIAVRAKVTRSRVDRIEIGMSKPAVDQILGHENVSRVPNGLVGLRDGFSEYHWDGDDGFASVLFDEIGQVIHKRWMGSRVRRESWLDKVRGWIWTAPPIPRE